MTNSLLAPVSAIAATLLVYCAAQRLQARFGYFFLNPVLLSAFALIALLKLTGISYATYNQGGRIISFMLGPAVVALAVPLYEELRRIAGKAGSIVASISLGSVVGILTAAGTAWALSASREIVLTLAPRSVTTPIAVGIAEKIGGIPSLAAALVIATGIFGAIVGPAILRLARVRSRTAVGLALGAAAHGIGTARAIEMGETEGALSGLAMGLNGIVTAILISLWLF